MILLFDENGSLTGSVTSEGYPARPEALALAKGQAAFAEDVPPFEPRYWYRTADGIKIRPRLDITTTETVEGGQKVLAINGVPVGGSVRVIGPVEGEIESDGEAVEIVFPQHGAYRVIVSADPYQPQEFDVIVEASNGTA